MELTKVTTDELFETIRPLEKRKGKAMGRPPGYRPEYAELARRLVRAGATRDALARAFEVAPQTISVWMGTHPDFYAAINSERWAADEKVAAALYKKATGYTRKVTKAMQHNGRPVLAEYTEEVPPDTAAAFIWLKNRQPELWRDRHEITGADGKPLQVELAWVAGRRVVDAEIIEPNEPGAVTSQLRDLEPEDVQPARLSSK